MDQFGHPKHPEHPDNRGAGDKNTESTPSQVSHMTFEEIGDVVELAQVLFYASFANRKGLYRRMMKLVVNQKRNVTGVPIGQHQKPRN